MEWRRSACSPKARASACNDVAAVRRAHNVFLEPGSSAPAHVEPVEFIGEAIDILLENFTLLPHVVLVLTLLHLDPLNAILLRLDLLF